MIKKDLVAERITIESYRDMVIYLCNNDPTTRRPMEEILAKEEEHAEDLLSLIQELQLDIVGKPGQQTTGDPGKT